MIDIQVIIAVWIFIIGLCIGSFLNVVVLRGLSGESIVLPPSKCPKCNNPLKWWMNIPVLSYLFLRGKCYYCKSPISPQYPLVELFCGVIFTLVFLKFGVSLETLFFLIASSILIVMGVDDIRESVIFEFHAYLLTALGLLFQLSTGGLRGVLFGLTGALCGFLIYEILARLGYPFVGQRAFGEGDSLIAAGIGAFFGWKFMLVSIFLSFLIMAAFSFPYFLISSVKAGRKRAVSALLGFLLVVAAGFLGAGSPLAESFLGSIFLLIILTAGTFYCAYLLLSDMKKEGAKGFCMLPFGPAMALSFLIIMFFSEQIKTGLLNYLTGAM